MTMLPILTIGPLNVQTGGLILVLSAWLGMVLTERLNKNAGIPGNFISDSLYWGAGTGIVFARLGYSLAAPAVLLQNPLSMFSLNTYQFDGISGLVGFFLAIAVFSFRMAVQFRLLLDALTPFCISIAAGYTISTLATGEVYGSPASLPWAVSIGGISRHPVQIYDLIFIIYFGYLLFKPIANLKDRIPQGGVFLILVAVLALSQIITIPFRADSSITYIAGVRLQQVATWIVLAGTLLILGKLQLPVQSNKEISG